MSLSPKYLALLTVPMLAIACGDSPTEVDPGPPTVEFQTVPPRSTALPPFSATRKGHDLTMYGTINPACTSFDTDAEAWHDEDLDALFVKFTFLADAPCELGEPVSYTAKVTGAGGSARFRVIHEWPGQDIPTDTVFKAIFGSG